MFASNSTMLASCQEYSRNGDVENLIETYSLKFGYDHANLFRLQKQISALEDVRSRSNFSGHITCSAILIDSYSHSVLLIKHAALGIWLAPGGHVEGVEKPEETSQRELREETGVTSFALHPWHRTNSFCPIDIDCHPIPPNRRKGEPQHYHHDFIYVFEPKRHEEALCIDESEVTGARWSPLDSLEAKYPRALKRLGNIL